MILLRIASILAIVLVGYLGSLRAPLAAGDGHSSIREVAAIRMLCTSLFGLSIGSAVVDRNEQCGTTTNRALKPL